MLRLTHQPSNVVATVEKRIWLGRSWTVTLDCLRCGRLQSARVTVVRAPGEVWRDGMADEVMRHIEPVMGVDACPYCGASDAEE